ncbi:MAG: GNAT family N-acetyltransferase [Caulobacteraceae bacterium]
MAGLTPPRPLTVEDDRRAFDCGRDSLNLWFRRHAWRNQASGVSRTSVVCDREGGQIVGYVSLSAAQIERAHLPKVARRNQPDPLPALLLGQLAVDLAHQGRGYARSLVIFALTTAVRFSREIGCFCVITHPLDDRVRTFYRGFGFEDLPFDPRGAMAVRIADLERNGFSGDLGN